VYLNKDSFDTREEGNRGALESSFLLHGLGTTEAESLIVKVPLLLTEPTRGNADSLFTMLDHICRLKEEIQELCVEAHKVLKEVLKEAIGMKNCVLLQNGVIPH
jgi:hypothetical protein